MQALLALGWLASRLGWEVGYSQVRAPALGTRPSQDVVLRVESGNGSEGNLGQITLTTRVGDREGRIDVTRNGEQMVTTMHGADLPELCRTTRYQWPSEAELLEVALGMRRHDDVFEKTVAAAEAIAALTTR